VAGYTGDSVKKNGEACGARLSIFLKILLRCYFFPFLAAGFFFAAAFFGAAFLLAVAMVLPP
jgi:hypothetical protein